LPTSRPVHLIGAHFADLADGLRSWFDDPDPVLDRSAGPGQSRMISLALDRGEPLAWMT